MFRSEIFDFFPEPGDEQGGRARTTRRASPTGRWTSSRRCWRATCPSTRTRSTPTGTTSATSTSCGRATSTRCTGEVEVEPGAPEVVRRRPRRERRSTGPRSRRPVLVGAGVELGEGVRIDGPAVIGDGCRVGDGARLRDAILLAGAELPGGRDPGRRDRSAARRSSAFADDLDAVLTVGAPRARRGVRRIGRMRAAARRRRRRWSPPLCAACGRACRPEAVALHRAARGGSRPPAPLCGAGPPGVDRAWSSAPHEGVARDLVTALKFRRLLPVAEPDGRADPLAGPGRPAQRRRSSGAGRAAAAALRAASTPPARSPPRSPSGSALPLRALPGAPRAAAARSGRRRAERIGQPPRIHAARRGARAASSWSTTCSPPARRSPPAPGPCAAPGAVRVVAVTFAPA